MFHRCFIIVSFQTIGLCFTESGKTILLRNLRDQMIRGYKRIRNCVVSKHWLIYLLSPTCKFDDQFDQRDQFDNLGLFFTFYCDQYFARAYRLEAFQSCLLHIQKYNCSKKEKIDAIWEKR